MKNFKNNYFRKISKMALLVSIFVFSLGASTNTGDKNKTNSLSKVQTAGEFFVFDINNLYIPIDNKGVIADVNPGDGIGPSGIFDGHTFLFSAGFYVSGYVDGELFGNGVLSASRIEDYQPGPVGSSKTDPKNVIYVVSQQDKPFGDSWQEWIDAVSIGADFYDGDGDGVYNPVDKNSNGKWDTDEDRPDILGDVTAWCVYNDGVPSALRRFSVNPVGLEIHQSVFGFKAKSIVGNLMFVRYRIKNAGEKTLEDVYFSAAADPDLGDYTDDLVGSDTTISAGFVYNGTADGEFGEDCPCFLMDFFQGPYIYVPGETFTDEDNDGIYTEGIDTPLDTAYVVKGPQLGIDVYPGAKNLPMTSMTQYMQSHPTHGDPDTHYELRNYMIGGHGKNGDSLYVSTWTYGNGDQLGADTSNIPARFMYSGEPEPQTGWLNIEPIDQRQMSNTGPFDLKPGEVQDIYVAYVVGRGATSLNSVTVAKEIDKTAQTIFSNNFPAPPPPTPIDYTVTTGDGFIDITFDTYEQVPYDVLDTVLIVRKKFEGFYISTYATPTKQTSINGVLNYKELVSYDLDNIIENIYAVDPDGNTNLLRAASDNKLDSLIYSDPAMGRIRYRITQNPFTGEPLIAGHEYYFSIGQYTLNHLAIYNREDSSYGAKGDYVDPTNSAYSEFETPIITVVYNTDENDPAMPDGTGDLAQGASDGAVKYLVVDKKALTGDDYSVEFIKDNSSDKYSVMWKLTNTTTNTTLIDSSKNFDFSDDNVADIVTEGFITKVKEVSPSITPLDVQEESFVADSVWYDEFNRPNFTGGYYVGEDIVELDDDLVNPIGNPVFPTSKSVVISADKVRNVVVKFGEPSMAYRYLNGFIGGAITSVKSYVYADGVTSADTVSKGPVGMWDDANDHAIGFVEVPFSVYTADEKYGDTGRKLAVGFIEAASDSRIPANVNPWGTPDGIWDPLERVDKSKEVIIIFDDDYDETGSNMLYTGGYDDAAGNKVWADIIKGYNVPAGSVSEEDSLIAASPFFNAMYVLNLQRKVQSYDTTIVGTDTTIVPVTLFYTDGDEVTLSLQTYPYTSGDEYTFTTRAGGALTENELQANFEKVNVFPNPLFAYNPQTSYDGNLNPDDPFVTFNHLPDDVTISIYSLSGGLLRTLTSADKATPTSQFLKWDLKNESGLRVASGLYIALVDSPKYGQKILKFSVILPQKQLQRY